MTLDTMSTEKTLSESYPVEIINVSTRPANDGMKTKKHVLIAIVSLIAVGLVVACVLVAIRLYSDSEEELVKYSLMYQGETGSAINQTVSVASNSVMYHVVQHGLDEWVINDFDKNLQIVKMLSNAGYVACFVTALNKSMAAAPDSIPSQAPTTNHIQAVQYKILPDPIPDITFLGTRASDMCDNIPTYWIAELCDTETTRVKRDGRSSLTIVSVKSNIDISNTKGSTVVVANAQDSNVNVHGSLNVIGKRDLSKRQITTYNSNVDISNTQNSLIEVGVVQGSSVRVHGKYHVVGKRDLSKRQTTIYNSDVDIRNTKDSVIEVGVVQGSNVRVHGRHNVVGKRDLGGKKITDVKSNIGISKTFGSTVIVANAQDSNVKVDGSLNVIGKRDLGGKKITDVKSNIGISKTFGSTVIVANAQDSNVKVDGSLNVIGK